MYHSLLESPALFVKSSRKSVMRDAKPTRPLSESACFSVVGQSSCFASILALLHSTCPFAIRRPSVFDALIAVAARIIAIIVFAFDAVITGWFIAHVRHEANKGIKPSFANHYSACAVAVVVLGFWVVATVLHVFPRVVLWRLVPATSACTVTPARFGRLLAKLTTSYCRSISTFTLAQPLRITTICLSGKFDHSEFVVLVSNFISAMFAASARPNALTAKRAAADGLFRSTFADANPVRASLASKITASVANSRQLSEWLATNVFDAAWQWVRLVCRHDSTPRKLDCDIEPGQSTTTASARFILVRSNCSAMENCTMASPTVFPGDIIVAGDARINGSIAPRIAKSNILALAELQAFPIPLTDFRVWDALQTLLPGTPSSDDLGLVGGTFGTATPSIRTEDLKAAGATNKRARFLVQLPWEYVAGESVTLRAKVGMITTVAGTSATIDLEAYKLQDDPDDAIGSDLVSSAAQSMNSLTFANIDFVITPTSLSPGDILDVRITIAVNDGASATAVIAGLTSLKLLCDVR